jgi:hypothetical protein
VSDQQIAWLGREQSEQPVEAEQLLVAQSEAGTVTSFHHGDRGRVEVGSTYFDDVSDDGNAGCTFSQ